MKKGSTFTALLAGASMLVMGSMATAQTSAIPGYDEAVAAAETAGWATSESERGGLYLHAQFDSSGEPAWDPAEHPLVYITSESHFNPNPNKTIEGGWAGFHLIDAYTKEVIVDHIGVRTVATGAAQFGELSEEDKRGPVQLRRAPHGVMTSPDGKWGYYGWTEIDRDAPAGMVSYVAITNMETMKIDKLLTQEHHFRGGPRAQSLHHVQTWVDEDGNHRVVIMFGFGADGGPHFILDPQDDNKVVRALNYEDVQLMGHPYLTPSPDGKSIYVSIGSPELRSSHYSGAGIAKVNLETDRVTNIMGTGNHPIGITHDVDGRYTYVVDGHHSAVYKIDNETDEVVGSTSAGVAGPYGISFNWDESMLFTVGKGEGSHNIGSALGIVDARIFAPSRTVRAQMPLFLGGSASSIDHAILHPDPEVNELWISNMNGWETIVLDLDTLEPTDWIATPNGGDTHSGGFIRYEPDFTGEVLIDMGGVKSESIRELVREAKGATN